MKKEIKVLLAEDNPVDVLLVTHTLEGDFQSAKITSVESRNDFIRALEHEVYDVILCDHSLRDFNSLDALMILNQSKKEIPFIVITGTNNPELAFKAINTGAYDYVLKSDILHLTTAAKNAINFYELKNELKRMKEKSNN